MTQTADFGLYIHIPFCERKCPYCDFNTYAGLDSLFSDLVDALCREMEQWHTALQGRTINTIFLGGGTPTVLDDSQLGQLFETVNRCFTLASNIEITSEANPGTVDRAKFRSLRRLGLNRLSMGVQSLQPAELTFLGRIHDVADVYQAVEAARAADIDNLNLDFMFGLPEQSVSAWENTLEQALTLQPEHLSLYSLIVEPNTPLAHWVKTGQAQAPDEDQAADHYEIAISRLAEAGYRQYEVSNWAKKEPSSTADGRNGAVDDTFVPALASRHNLVYWRNGEYLGIGPGAHSHLRRNQAGALIDKRWGNRKPVPGYIKRIQQGKPVEESHEIIDSRSAMGETMMLGLRLVEEGVSFAQFAHLHEVDMKTIFGSILSRLQAWGLLEIDEERVRLTQRGLMVGNQVFMEFIESHGASNLSGHL